MAAASSLGICWYVKNVTYVWHHPILIVGTLCDDIMPPFNWQMCTQFSGASKRSITIGNLGSHGIRIAAAGTSNVPHGKTGHSEANCCGVVLSCHHDTRAQLSDLYGAWQNCNSPCGTREQPLGALRFAARDIATAIGILWDLKLPDNLLDPLLT